MRYTQTHGLKHLRNHHPIPALLRIQSAPKVPGPPPFQKPIEAQMRSEMPAVQELYETTVYIYITVKNNNGVVIRVSVSLKKSSKRRRHCLRRNEFIPMPPFLRLTENVGVYAQAIGRRQEARKLS